MAQLAIKGHATRGEEVIEILEMLGYINKHKYTADCDSLCFYGTKGTNIIYYVWVNNCYEDENTLIFTLEEFLEKFPYKVGDKVSSKYLKNYKVSKMEWESVNNRVIYKLQGMGWYSANELQPYEKETMDKANKAVFDANAQCCDIMNHLIKKETMEEIKIDIPKGYEFAGVDDDKQQVVFTKIGYYYPKTYEECCEILYPNENFQTVSQPIKGHNGKKLFILQKLLICRDAYWKIAGEQMELDKPWEYDMSKDEFSYAMSYQYGYIQKNEIRHKNAIFAFPTAEMRDVFKENFKDLIELCKEFL